MENNAASFARTVLDIEHLGKPEDRGSRMLKNGAMFAISTAADLVESKVFRTAKTLVFEGKTKRLERELEEAFSRKDDAEQIQAVRDALRKHKAVESGVDFAEEVLSDELLINHGGNKLLNRVAGEGGKATYAQATAEIVSDYANTLIQVFANDRWIGWLDKDGKPKQFMGMYMAEKSMNFINPINVEAALRILSDIPKIGMPIAAAKNTVDAFFKNDKTFYWVNKGIAKFLLGFHVSNSQTKAVHKATPIA